MESNNLTSNKDMEKTMSQDIAATFSNSDVDRKFADSQDVTITDEKPNNAIENQVPLTLKDIKSLKKSSYEKIHNNSAIGQKFLLQNKKTKQIVELKAFSSYHACKIIGWKPNQVKVIQVTNQ